MKLKLLMLLLLSTITMSFTHAQWTQTNGPEGGVVNCLTKVGNEIWMGAMGGIFISSNDGLSWQKSELFKNRIIGAIYSSGDTILVQFGHRGDVHFWTFYEYIAASFDQGQTWSQPFQTSFCHYDSIVTGGKFQNCQGKIVFEKRGQIIYSNDHGLSWVQINQPNPPQDYYYLVDYTNILAVGYDRHHYVTQDFSQTWNDLGIFNNYTQFISDSLWLGLLRVDYPTYSQFYIFRSINEGGQWDTVCQVPENIMVGPVYMDESTLFFESNGITRLKSDDYGLTWQQVPLTPEINSVFLYTANGDKLVRGKRGLLRSIPSQAQIIPCNSGFFGTHIQQIHGSDSDLYCTTDFGVFKSGNGGINWIQIFESPFHYLRTTSFITKGDTILFTDMSIYELVRSFDGGVSWDSVPLPWGIYMNGSYLAIQGNRLYISLNGFRVSDDWGTTWNPMASLPQLTNPGPGNFFPGGFLYSIDSILYSISSSGYIFQYDNLSDTWIYVWNFHSEDLLGVNLLSHLDNFLVASGDKDLAYSDDQGFTWTSPNNIGLPVVGGVQYFPREIKINQNVWIGINHYLGFYQSGDQGNNWSFQSNLDADFIPNCMAELNGILYCGSSNLGIWKYSATVEPISGKVYHDINHNGIEDLGESGIAGCILSTSPGNWYATTADSGFFTMINSGNLDTLRIINPQPLATVSPPWRLIQGTSQNQDFGIYLEPDIADLSIDLTNTNFFRPGFDSYLKIKVLNKGSVNQTPLIQFLKPDICGFVSANPAPLSMNGDTLTWQLGSLGFLQETSITLILNTPAGTPLGTAVYGKATAFPVAGDTLPDDNISVIYDIVRASYDPNDKTCVQGEYFTPAAVAAGEALEFIVRFQNLGTLATSFIRITDTLSPYLDWSTFRFISSSHPVRWSLHGKGIIEFLFDPLALPPASIDELGSMGFVKYSIRCKPEVQIGTAITNTAYIFFDFNPAVITNTTTTLIANIYTSINEPAESETLPVISIFPNPASDYLTIEVSGEMKSPLTVVIHDLSGRQVLKSGLEQNRRQLNLLELPAGFYMGGVFDQHGRKTGVFKFILNPK